ncbi:restriction endonuclease subunit R [Pedobacter sp. HMF7647]|uniref:Restriction endonuclease subunit R n=1 Tax=Hufsiella arboris TaxID=2695275 RepID=A0A7K1YA43_9SPHI|nr:type I restriction enzyme HsdR N-terminal domain-containing protein [Hufsiella arboris]MXV51442.1 restriction endonuclease subunit R [Hufsiella arboris]
MFQPIPLNLPEYPFRIRHDSDVTYIFDEVRKKYLVLTPEEWVRQHFVKFLINERNYPRTLIKLEGGLTLNTLKKRSDITVFNTLGKIILLIECKAPSVKISQKTLDQVARYNMIHQTETVGVTNGLTHCFFKINFFNKSYEVINQLPYFS